MLKKMTFIALFLVTLSAKADQCQLVGQKVAAQSVELILNAHRIDTFCELCGDEAPTPVNLTNVSVFKKDGDWMWEVSLNGKTIDLAYTYVNGVNLAKVVGCETFGVTPIIK